MADVEWAWREFGRDVLKVLARMLVTPCPLSAQTPNMSAEIARQRHLCIYEIGISYFGRTYAEGKKIDWKDRVKALWYIFKFRFR
jgi:hypothetical protein